MGDFFAKKVVNDFCHRHQCSFSRKYNPLRPVIAARCTPLYLIAHHCKLGEIFLLKRLKHKKSRKSSLTFGIYSSIFIGFSVAFRER